MLTRLVVEAGERPTTARRSGPMSPLTAPALRCALRPDGLDRGDEDAGSAIKPCYP